MARRYLNDGRARLPAFEPALCKMVRERVMRRISPLARSGNAAHDGRACPRAVVHAQLAEIFD
jgi:hypothetical protein